MNALLDPAVERNTGRNASIRSILLVDDEIDLWWDRDLAALAAAGYDVDTAEDGEAGWKALQTNEYDLLITDNKMPELWGWRYPELCVWVGFMFYLFSVAQGGEINRSPYFNAS